LARMRWWGWDSEGPVALWVSDLRVGHPPSSWLSGSATGCSDLDVAEVDRCIDGTFGSCLGESRLHRSSEEVSDEGAVDQDMVVRHLTAGW
jgi:hypothetical protein